MSRGSSTGTHNSRRDAVAASAARAKEIEEAKLLARVRESIRANQRSLSDPPRKDQL